MIQKESSFLEMIEAYAASAKEKKWEGTLSDYIAMIIEKPHLHMSAHQRVLKAIESAGIDRNEDGDIVNYKFFENDLFGVEEPIEELMSYLRAAATGSEIARRILLFYGPTSSGKSQMAILLKKGLEKFSHTEEGAIFCLSQSPMYEDPLTAVPQELRKQFLDEYGIRIEGQLSPLMELKLREEYNGDFMKLPVKQYYVSEKDRASIGVFVPADKRNQDLSELVGSMDLSTIGKYGAESDPRAYRFDGELNVANRGIMEFIEMLKVDQKFLYVLLTLAQEKNIKTGRFPLIWADEFIVAHTNESEYKKFLGQDELEALHDRTIVVRFPYNLKVSDEVKIYEKLINQASFNGVHIAPHTLRCAAIFAILSRLKESNNQGLTAMNKLRLYDEEQVEGFSPGDVAKFKKEFFDEGMVGLSPRYVINRISSTLAEDGITTVSPIDVIRSLRDGLSSNPKIDKKTQEKLEMLLVNVIEEYNKLAKNDVQKAFFVNFESEIVNLLKNYMDHIEAYLDGKKLENEWGEAVEPDERLMRSVEEKVLVSESGKKSFRQEIYRKMLRSEMDYKSHAKLREALEKQLFDERQDIIRLTVSSRNPDEEELRKINVVIDTLCEKHGYTADSANQLLRYVSSLMARN